MRILAYAMFSVKTEGNKMTDREDLDEVEEGLKRIREIQRSLQNLRKILGKATSVKFARSEKNKN